MVKLTEQEKNDCTDVWKKKIGVTEYYAFRLCKGIIDQYEQGLDYIERELEKGNVLFSRVSGNVNYELFKDSIFTLQMLLGDEGYPWQKPRSLEQALQETGLGQEYIDPEVQNCRDYLRKTTELKDRSENLSDQLVRKTIDILGKKANLGVKLYLKKKEKL